VSIAGDALRTAVLKTLADDVGDTIKGGKASLLGAMQEADIEKMAARLPDGTKAASLTVVGGEQSPRVTDPAALLAWVQANRPDQAEVIVRPSYVESVLKAAKLAGRALDRKSGDVIPGISFEPTTAYVKVDFTEGDIDGREHIRRAWRSGAVSLPSVLALPAPESEAS
jgi:hypothetical protein